MQVKTQQLQLDMEKQTGSKLGKEHLKAVYCYSNIFNICRVHHAKCWAGWSTNGIKIAERSINSLKYAEDTTFKAESEEELNSLLMKEESEKVGLKLNIQKTKIMASGPITS